MTKTLTEQWAIITPENCQEINTMISGYKKQIERLQKQLEIATKALKDIMGWDEYDCMGLAKKALEEMEGVK